MVISNGNGNTEYGMGISISLSSEQVCQALIKYIDELGVKIDGPRTITVNGKLVIGANIYVDPSGTISMHGRTKLEK